MKIRMQINIMRIIEYSQQGAQLRTMKENIIVMKLRETTNSRKIFEHINFKLDNN